MKLFSKKINFRYILLIVTIMLLPKFINSTDLFKSGQSSKLNSDITNLQVTKSIASMPLTFTENQGQWDEKVKFRANAGGATMWFSSDGAYYQFTRTIEKQEYSIVDKRYGMMPDDMMDRQPDSIETMMIKAHFMGSNPAPVMVGLKMMEYKCNYFIGNEPSKWHSDVPNYSAVLYEQVYDGIDLKYYGNGKQMEYDFIVEPGADYSQIKIQYEGAESVSVNDKGELVVKTMWGEVVEQKPIIYQVINNSRVSITGEYSLKDINSFGFELSNYDKSKPLVIDPVLVYSTYLGGSNHDYGKGIDVDDYGNAYIAGHTRSSNFPIFEDLQIDQSDYDAFVTKLNSTGDALVYSTYLGGRGYDEASAIAIDSEGNAYITGRTGSDDFPIVGEFQSNQGSSDVFVTKINNNGNALIYSTYLGGQAYDEGKGIAVDDDGNAYVTGYASISFPLKNEYQIFKRYKDAFITKFNAAGDDIIYSTYLGGDGFDVGNDIALDNLGNAYITGTTESEDFPTKNAFQSTYQSIYGFDFLAGDAFVAKLNSSGNDLVYSTYIGGTKSDHGMSIALDDSSYAYVTGSTESKDFPIKGELQTYNDINGTEDVFVTKLNREGNDLVYSTYLGGNDYDIGLGIDVDGIGNTFITGYTRNGLQIVGEDQTWICEYSTFLTSINSTGDSINYSFCFGGSHGDEGNSIVLDNLNNIYISGNTMSPDFPTLNAYQSTLQGEWTSDAFVAKFSNVTTDIDEFKSDNLPSNYNVSQNYPNPFNPTTTIEFELPKRSRVSINIYNLLGQKIKSLGDKEYSAGNHRISWDGTSSSGVKVSTGIYFYRLETDDFVETKKMLLLK